MIYQISSKNFDQPLLKPLLEVLIGFFNSIDTKFFVIGATARDMIMDAHSEKSSRATRDLDIAIAIPDWKKYADIEEGLLKLKDFQKDNSQKQRFSYQGFYTLDIVPFGDIMKLDDKIFWPPDEQTAMSVLGFDDVSKATIEITIDEHLTLNAASLPGIFLLKIVAWKERHLMKKDDADDIGFILRNYFSINENRIATEHIDLYDDPDFSLMTAGAMLIGRDIGIILQSNNETKHKIIAILESEISLEEESKLINHILETNRVLKYEEVRKCITNIITGLNHKSN
ncbi:MAG TPA: nucleotidyl transferase AbiEii/AbiGii toxin family protein [Bacteroidales bacterium]|nr:nucleotidyl transferase AbiEii/AbiGii toxin family protein [Bacteroidales bacterium]